jgi:GTP-binding protein
VLNKMELCDAEELEERGLAIATHTGQPPLDISAAASQGLDALLAAVWQQLGIA